MNDEEKFGVFQRMETANLLSHFPDELMVVCMEASRERLVDILTREAS